MNLAIEPNLFTQGTTLASRYESLGKPASPDPEGRRVNYAAPYSIGVVQEILTIESSRERRILSRNSQLAARSLADIWQRGQLLPLMEGAIERPTLTDQIAIFGGWRRWGNLADVDQGIQEGALWRATPRGIWELVLGGKSHGIEGQIPDAPRAVKRSHSGSVTSAHQDRDLPTDIPREQKMVPDLSWMYSAGKRNDEDRYRTGGKKLDPPITPTRSTSFQDRWAEEAERRGLAAQPEVWKTVPDSKQAMVNEILTGNRDLPTTYWNYHTMWRQIFEWAQRTKRGGLTSRNWLRMEMKAEDWVGDTKSDSLSPGWLIADEVKAPASPGWNVVGSPPVRSRRRYGHSSGNMYRPSEPESSGSRRRCGSRATQTSRAVEVGGRIFSTQYQYGEKLTYAVTTHKMEVLMQSISAATKVGYQRSWEQWVNFCNGKNQAAWMDSREEGWGGI